MSLFGLNIHILLRGLFVCEALLQSAPVVCLSVVHPSACPQKIKFGVQL